MDSSGCGKYRQPHMNVGMGAGIWNGRSERARGQGGLWLLRAVAALGCSGLRCVAVLRAVLLPVSIMMKQLESLTKYWEEEEFRSHLVINHNISVFLECCEAAIRGDCGVAVRRASSKQREAPKQFKEAFAELSREEKIEYYLRVMGYLRSFVEETFNAPISPYSGLLCEAAWARGRRWKEKKFRLDQGKHLLFVERKSKILSFDLKDYLLRASKNKDYHSLVLLATNNNPPEKHRALQIGFTDPTRFQLWFDSLKFSTEFRQWELYCSLYKGHIAKISEIPALSPSPPHHNQPKLNQSFTAPRKRNDKSDDDDPLSRSLYQPDQLMNFGRAKEEPKQGKAKEEEGKAKGEGEGKEEEAKGEGVQGEVAKLQAEIAKYEEKRRALRVAKTMIGQLLEGEVVEEPEALESRIEEEDEQEKQLKRCLDLFHKLCPEYDLAQLQAFSNFNAIHEEPSFRIYQNHLQPRRFKVVVSIPQDGCSLPQLMAHLCKPETAKAANANIEELQIKTYIPSENSALLYQVLRPYNRLYRARDFVFLRHVFRQGGALYMVDKSIENANYPPFLTIVRGSLSCLYGLFQRPHAHELIVDAEVSNEGYLNALQDTNLTLNFLRPFRSLAHATPDPTAYRLFDLDWDIGNNEINRYDDEIRSRINIIRTLSREDIEDEPGFKTPSSDRSQENSESKHTQPQRSTEGQKGSEGQERREGVSGMEGGASGMEEGELRAEEQEEPKLEVVRELSKQGDVVVEDAFRTHRYLLRPVEKEAARVVWLQAREGHPIWRRDWQHDDKLGGITFVNAKKIEDQKGVLRFILTKMAKNLVSGQSILNVSLPVDIFCPESNLQSFLRSMAYAPLLLEGLAQADALARLLRTVAFGVTNSVLYLNMEKPFNPQLGETFQCWINGCPAYAEQVSHHPPVAALLLKGRGYDVSAQLESKISVGVNSGTGTNDGVYRVRFADHMEVCFVTPGGEVSGLAHGDRKFNFVGKSYYWIAASNLILELTFDPYRRGFFAVGRPQQPCDYFEGTIWEVKPEFMGKFFGGKRREPGEKERVRSLGKVSGVWNKHVLFNGAEIFNLDRELPLAIEHERAPLPSDSNWRNDIEYRRRNQTTRAQIEKERLELQQRQDRKLRDRNK